MCDSCFISEWALGDDYDDYGISATWHLAAAFVKDPTLLPRAFELSKLIAASMSDPSWQGGMLHVQVDDDNYECDAVTEWTDRQGNVHRARPEELPAIALWNETPEDARSIAVAMINNYYVLGQAIKLAVGMTS